MSEETIRDVEGGEEIRADAPSGPHGCLTALVLGVGLFVAGGLGLAWVVTLEPSLVPSNLGLDLGRALGYAAILGVPSALVALLLRDERFALWRGFGLTLALAGLHAGLVGVLLAVDRSLLYPGVPGVVPPLVSLLFGLAVIVAGRKRFLSRPQVAPMLLGVGLGLLVSAAWFVVGVLGTLSEALLAVLEAVSSGLVGAVLVASLFFYDGEMPARRPFWSVVLVGVTFGALQNGLLAVRGYWLQGSMLSQAFSSLGYLAGVLLTLDEQPDARRLWWTDWAYFTVIFLIPFAWTEGLEGDWMLDEMVGAWMPGLFASLITGLVLGGLALAARRWLARPAVRRAAAGVVGVLGVGVASGAYAGFGQPGIQPEVFFVVMEDQADTTFAQEIEDHEERYTAVYETLTEHALEDQSDIRAYLDSQHVSYAPYYLVNGIEVVGDAGLRRELARREDVARVLNSPQARPLPRIRETNTPGLPGGFDAQLTWGVDEMDAERVWDEYGVTGEGIIVGHADSGVDGNHPALRDNYLGSGGSNDYTWFDPWEGTTEPTDSGGHGTHTLGTILGQGGIGVAPGAKWIACRNLARNLGNPPDYLDCMQFLLAPHPQDGDPFTEGDPSRGAHVTSNSWGCPPEEGCDGLTLSIAVQHLRDAGQFFVVSAGNDGPQCSTVWAPASAEAAFSVGAASQSGLIANFSSRGPVLVDESGRLKPEVTAPGVGVLSSVPGGSYGFSDGTSMAGPHVAGLVALVWSANPDLIGDVDATERIIEETAHPHSAPDLCGATEGDQNNVYGYGFVDALGAVEMAMEGE